MSGVGTDRRWIAEKVMRRDHGLITNLIVGVAGAFLGSFLATLIGFDAGEGVIPSLLIATAGAILCCSCWAASAARSLSA